MFCRLHLLRILCQTRIQGGYEASIVQQPHNTTIVLPSHPFTYYDEEAFLWSGLNCTIRFVCNVTIHLIHIDIVFLLISSFYSFFRWKLADVLPGFNAFVLYLQFLQLLLKLSTTKTIKQ